MKKTIKFLLGLVLKPILYVRWLVICFIFSLFVLSLFIGLGRLFEIILLFSFFFVALVGFLYENLELLRKFTKWLINILNIDYDLIYGEYTHDNLFQKIQIVVDKKIHNDVMPTSFEIYDYETITFRKVIFLYLFSR
ncbi:MAG TPA: hypothetical protein VJ892_00490 [Candidatus Absconditabacterales bacterium]|nr:hypothetical protein [Candidatus Absconditabacterales bacterium]